MAKKRAPSTNTNEDGRLAKIRASQAARQQQSTKLLDDSGRFPYPYGSDLHWFWGGKRIEDRLARDDGTNQYEPWIFRPDVLAGNALMQFSICYPAIIKRIQDGLDFVERMFEEWERTHGVSDNVMRAMGSLSDRIKTGAEIIAKSEAANAEANDKSSTEVKPPTQQTPVGKQGVALLDAAIILNDDEPTARETVARWHRSRNPKLPPSIGCDLKHRQRKLYELLPLLEFIRLSGDNGRDCEKSLRHKLREPRIVSEKTVRKPSAPSAKLNRRKSQKSRQS